MTITLNEDRTLVNSQCVIPEVLITSPGLFVPPDDNRNVMNSELDL